MIIQPHRDCAVHHPKPLDPFDPVQLAYLRQAQTALLIAYRLERRARYMVNTDGTIFFTPRKVTRREKDRIKATRDLAERKRDPGLLAGLEPPVAPPAASPGERPDRATPGMLAGLETPDE